MLTMDNVIREGHETLAIRAKEVNVPLSNEDKLILKEMMEFLVNSQTPEISEEYELRPGVGLAAPQVNISKRMIAILTTDEKDEKLYQLLLVNPKIISHSVAQTYLPGGEGCLSVDREVTGLVSRHKKITLRAHNFNPDTNELKEVNIRVSGYVSIVLQHEIDHLNGILFVDKLVEELPGVEPVIFVNEVEDEESVEEN